MTPVLAPGLSAGIDQYDGQTGARRGGRGGETRRTGTDDGQLSPEGRVSVSQPPPSCGGDALQLHAVDRRHQARALVRRAVDGQQTVVADADAAEESAGSRIDVG